MDKVRKIFHFILGWLSVPFVLSLFTLFVLDFKSGISFWSLIYLIGYILFPLLYRGNVSIKFSNKYMFYGVIYFILAVILGVLYFV